MRLDKELEIETIREEIEKQNCKLDYVSGVIHITNPYNLIIAISKSRFSEPNEPVYYIDCELSAHYGINNFVREWKDKNLLKDYLIKICIPPFKYLAGYSTVTKERAIELVEAFLKKNKVDYTFSPRLAMRRKTVSWSGEFIYGSNNEPCFYFKRNNKMYGILFYLSDIGIVELSEDFIIQYELSWYSFCPVYKTGDDYVNTAVANFFEFIDSVK